MQGTFCLSAFLRVAIGMHKDGKLQYDKKLSIKTNKQNSFKSSKLAKSLLEACFTLSRRVLNFFET